MKWTLLLLTFLVGITVGHLLSRSPERIEDAVEDRGVGLSSDLYEATNEEMDGVLSSDRAVMLTLRSLEVWLRSIDDMPGLMRHRAISEFVAGLSPRQYSKAVELLNQLESNLRLEVLNLIYQQWATIDSKGMWAYSETVDANLKQELRVSLFTNWARIDFDAAWEQATQVSGMEERTRLLGYVLNAAVQKEPLKVLESLQTATLHGNTQTWMYQHVYRALAERDPDLALQMAANLPSGVEKRSALVGSLLTLGEHDMNAAIARLDTLSMDSAVFRARKDLLRSISSKDFASVQRLIETQPNPELKQDYLDNVQLHTMAQGKSFDEVLEIYAWAGNNLSEAKLKQQQYGIYSSLVQSDLPRAMDYILELPPGNTRVVGLNSIASVLVQQDLQSAIEFADTLPYPKDRVSVLSNMTHRILQEGVESASAFLLQNNDPYLQRSLSGQLMKEWSAYDRESAIEWMSQLTDQDAINSAQTELVKVWAEEDPVATVQYIESELVERLRGRAYHNVINELTTQDPMEAIAWLEYLPEEGINNEGNLYGRIARRYSEIDPMTASEWIADLEKGSRRDASVQSLVRSISISDPDSGFIWANSIDDANLRKSSQRQAIRAWAKLDKAAAYRAVRDARVDVAEKVLLFAEIEKLK